MSRWYRGRLNQRGDLSGAGRRCLVVFVPGIYATLPQLWEYNELLTHLDDALWRRFHERHWLPFRYLATFWSPASPDEVARKLVKQIEQLVVKTRYDAIVLVAHSFGGLLLRRALILAKDRMWFQHVERVILLASTSRGLIPGTSLQVWLAAIGKRWELNRVGIGRLALPGLKPSAWLDQLSREWRSFLTAQNRPERPLRVVQIQGTRDRVIELDDDTDLRALPNFQELQIPNAGHRYFLLKQRWLRTTDPVVAEALQAIAQALDDAVMKQS